MRILVTGMTSVTTASERARVKYDTITTVLPTILRDMGHEVTWKGITVGEELPYDLAFIEVFSWDGLATGARRFGAMWAAINLPHVMVVGDWQHKRIHNGLTPKAFWNTYMLGDKMLPLRKILVRRGDDVDRVIESWSSKRHPTLMPGFTWGSRDYSYVAGSPCIIDPSRYLPQLVTERRLKERYWVYATLKPRKDLDKLVHQANWPIAFYTDRKPQGDSRVDEDFLTQEVLTEARGTLVPSYPGYAGNGWWRHRYCYAAQARCISLTTAECPLPSFQPRMADIEAMTDAQLDTLADAQAVELEAASEPRELVKETLATFIRTLS